MLVWLQDFNNPFFFGERVGINNKKFKMIKIRSMVVSTESTGIESTSANDNRITKIGKLIRRFKIDELSQLWNVLIGDMSLVGPRPNTLSEVSKYSDYETKLLSVKPGITDISSIVFSDEGEILKNETDPEIAYDFLIRPWKSQLGIKYVQNRSFSVDVYLILATLVCLFNRRFGLGLVHKLLVYLDADANLIKVAARNTSLHDFRVL